MNGNRPLWFVIDGHGIIIFSVTSCSSRAYPALPIVFNEYKVYLSVLVCENKRLSSLFINNKEYGMYDVRVEAFYRLTQYLC